MILKNKKERSQTLQCHESMIENKKNTWNHNQTIWKQFSGISVSLCMWFELIYYTAKSKI